LEECFAGARNRIYTKILTAPLLRLSTRIATMYLFKKPKKILIIADRFDASFNVFFKHGLIVLKNSSLLTELIDYSLKDTSSVCSIGKKISSGKYRAIIFLRFSHADGSLIADIAKKNSVRTYYFIDDDFFSLAEEFTDSNLAHHTNEKSLRDRANNICSVNTVLCSTDHLAQMLKSRFKVNTLSPFHPIFLRNYPFIKKNELVIGYMGSKGHKHDLESLTEDLSRLLDTHKSLRFETFGSIEMPASLQRFGNRVSSYTNSSTYESFIEKLHHLNWKIGLAPLVHNKTNQSKAFTKYIEYSSAAIPTAASRNSTYDLVIRENAGFLISDGDWYYQLNKILEKDLEDTVSNAQANIVVYAPPVQAQNLRFLFE
ncbi:MAG: hypothetical protein ACLGG0_14400, partial [Bacteriovoracia bacterium]